MTERTLEEDLSLEDEKKVDKIEDKLIDKSQNLVRLQVI